MSIYAQLRKRTGDFLRKVGLLPSADIDDFPIDAWADPAYESWYRTHAVSPESLNAQREATFDFEPLFSLIVPLYKTPRKYLDDMAQSVLMQSYSMFELILVNASPDDESLAADVKRLCDSDYRVREVKLDGNHGITENTNRGIEAATGDYLCFLDHDDLIEPDTLFEYARAIDEDRDIDILYCDEDMVQEDESKPDGFAHLHPIFKPAYSPDQLMCRNYAIHFLCIRKNLMLALPRPKPIFDGSQDFNNLLAASERARKVKGIQKVLYHWRISDASTATNPDSKPYSKRASRLAIQQHLARIGCQGKIIGSGIDNLYNIWFSGNAMDRPKVALIVDCRESDTDAGRFLESLAQVSDTDNLEVLLIDNDPDARYGIPHGFDAPVRVLDASGQTRFEALNAAVGASSGSILVFLDAGCVFMTPEPLEQLAGMLKQDGVGVVSPKTLYADGSSKCYGVAVTAERIMPLFRGYPDEFPAYECNTRAILDVSACALQGMAIRASDFVRVGGFDVSFSSEVACADLCKRMRDVGLRIVQTPTVKVKTSSKAPARRYDSLCNSDDFSIEDVLLYDSKWPGSRSVGDEYYNRNVDQSTGYMQIQRVEI